jgi:alanyl-tRNA synthetase
MKSVEGVEIKVPPDFYKRVSERHLVVEPVSVKEVDVPPDLSTEELYYYDPYWRSMSARVIYADKNMLVLDKTVFYGESGGQVGDKGKVVIDGVEYNVLDTIKKNNALIHLTDKPVGKELIGKGVTGYIDWDRRYSLMRHHTATHIILGAIRRVLGSHIWQAGAEKREDIAHIDVTHYKLPTDDEVRMIEELANKVVEEGVDVEVSWLDRGYAEKIYGVKIYQGGMVPGRKLRLVKIGDWDVEACGGTHVLNTRELMYIRIVSVDKIHDGIIRFSYVAGLNAIKQARDEQDILSRVAGILGVGRRDVERSIKSILEDMDRLKDELEELEKKYVSLLGERLYSNAEVIDGIKFVYVVGEVDKNIKLGEFLESRYDDVLFLGVSRLGRGVNIVIFVGGKLRERGINAFELGRRCLSDIAKGGKGDARYARFGGRFEDRLDIIKEIIVEGVRDEQ